MPADRIALRLLFVLILAAMSMLDPPTTRVTMLIVGAIISTLMVLVHFKTLCFVIVTTVIIALHSPLFSMSVAPCWSVHMPTIATDADTALVSVAVVRPVSATITGRRRGGGCAWASEHQAVASSTFARPAARPARLSWQFSCPAAAVVSACTTPSVHTQMGAR
jgi:hypothetical protein